MPDPSSSETVTQPASDDQPEVVAASLPPQIEPVMVPSAVPVDTLVARIATADADDLVRLGLQVTGPQQGRRRAGRAFGLQPVIIPLVNLDQDALRAIDNDPLLSWAVVEMPVTDAPAEGDMPDEGAA